MNVKITAAIVLYLHVIANALDVSINVDGTPYTVSFSPNDDPNLAALSNQSTEGFLRDKLEVKALVRESYEATKLSQAMSRAATARTRKLSC